MSALGLIGILFFVIGVALLWLARREILYWVQEFFRILRGEVSRRGGLSREPQGEALPGAPVARPARSMGTLLLLGGFALVLLGQVLFLLDLAF